MHLTSFRHALSHPSPFSSVHLILHVYVIRFGRVFRSFLDVTGAAFQIMINSFIGRHMPLTGTDCFGATAALGRTPMPSVKGVNL